MTVRNASGGHTEIDISGYYRLCESCRAPVIVPFPPDWHLGFTRDRNYIYLTPHRPDCTSP